MVEGMPDFDFGGVMLTADEPHQHIVIEPDHQLVLLMPGEPPQPGPPDQPGEYCLVAYRLVPDPTYPVLCVSVPKQRVRWFCGMPEGAVATLIAMAEREMGDHPIQ